MPAHSRRLKERSHLGFLLKTMLGRVIRMIKNETLGDMLTRPGN